MKKFYLWFLFLSSAFAIDYLGIDDATRDSSTNTAGVSFQSPRSLFGDVSDFLSTYPKEVECVKKIALKASPFLPLVLNRYTLLTPIGRFFELLTPHSGVLEIFFPTFNGLEKDVNRIMAYAAYSLLVDVLDFYNPSQGSHVHFSKLILSSTMLLFGASYLCSKDFNIRDRFYELNAYRHTVLLAAVVLGLLGYPL
jgi:hypothetical protein